MNQLLKGVGMAVAIVTMAFGVRWMLDPMLGPEQPFHFFYLPIVLAAWIGGFWPGMVALAAGLFLGNWYFIEPRFAFAIDKIDDLIAAIVYLVAGCAFAVFGHIIRTKHQQLAASLREVVRQKELMTTTLASVGDAVVMTDDQGRVTFMSAEAERTTGWKRSMADGMAVTEIVRLIDAVTREPIENLVERTKRSNGFVMDDALLQVRSNTETWVDLRAAVVADADRSTAALVFVLRNITDRKRARDALDDQRQRLELALAAGKMAAWEWSVATAAMYWSPELERIHGLAAGTFPGRFADFKRHVHPDDIQRVLGELQRSLDLHHEYHVEYRIRRSTGAVRWLEAFGKVSLGPDGHPAKIAGVVRDITEYKDNELVAAGHR